MYKIIFSTRGRAKFNEAIDWYEDKQDGLGKRFAAEAKDRFAIIKKQPDRYPIKQNKLREAQILDFPYHIIHAVNEQEKIITITSVFHTKRHPQNKYRP